MENNQQVRVLVTGSSGFIGTNLVSSLISLGYNVLGVDVVKPKMLSHLPFWRSASVLDYTTLNKLAADFAPEVIIHLAARTDLDGLSLDDYRVNSEGTKIVADIASRSSSVRRVLFASTRLVNQIGYRPVSNIDYSPSTYYGESKVLGEQVILALNPSYDWFIFRPTSIWGPWFGVPYRNFFDAVLTNKYVHPKKYKVLKSFGYVENSVYQLIKLMTTTNADSGSLYYLADYLPIEVLEFAKHISNQANQGSIKEVPIEILKIMGWTGDLLKILGMKNPPLTSFRLNNLITEMLYDTTNLERITGVLPYSHAEGIARTLLWMKENK